MEKPHKNTKKILRNQKLKRAIDVGGAIFGLAVFSPLLIPACILIRLGGSKETFFKQERLGKEGKPFKLYKLTTMSPDAHIKGPLLSKTDDPRITKVGKFVRTLSLNELAQFINVLKGEMSIVGPRPEVPEYAQHWPQEVKEKILSMKPGITGCGTITYWQESTILNDKDNPEDYYIKHIAPPKSFRLKVSTWITGTSWRISSSCFKLCSRPSMGKEKAVGNRDLSSKKVLVTGAGGFIGSHLVEELERTGARVKAFVHYNSRNDWGLLEFLPKDTLKAMEVVAGDICDPFSIRKAVKGCEIVFHLAALIGIPYSYVAPQSYVGVNVQGTLNILQASLDEGVEKVIHTSTSEVYGTAQYVPIDEKHPLNPQSPYAASKVSADNLAQSYYLSFNLPVAIIRPFNTFGPRQSARAVIPTIISQALTNGSVKLGSLEPVRDLTYVKDMVQGFLAVARSEACVGTTTNVGTGEGVAIDELAKTISKVMGKEFDLEVDKERIRPEKSEVLELICDYSRAKELTDWEPQYSLEDGLRESVEWIRENLGRYKMEIYNI